MWYLYDKNNNSIMELEGAIIIDNSIVPELIVKDGSECDLYMRLWKESLFDFDTNTKRDLYIFNINKFYYYLGGSFILSEGKLDNSKRYKLSFDITSFSEDIENGSFMTNLVKEKMMKSLRNYKLKELGI